MLPAQHIAMLIGPPSFYDRVHSDMDLMNFSQNGLKSSSIKHLARNASLKEVEVQTLLGIPDRTYGRRLESGHLSKQESDRLIMLAQAFALAIDVLGGAQKAKLWLMTENTALGEIKPIDILGNYLGCMKVIELINRIKFGIYS